MLTSASTSPLSRWRLWRDSALALRDDPWGHGNSLEWATSSPPPRHNFVELPRIRSERPAFELHYPHLLERLQAEAHAGRRHEPYVTELVSETGGVAYSLPSVIPAFHS